MTAYYNEFDPKAAAWLRELVAGGRIAPGDVDERDIRDIRPDELRTYRQCHFFAGIGGWSLALRRAGWADDRPVWTGSCPCQPFSAAGKRGGTADERHLWPAFFHLIDQCRPPVVFGEQVASKDGLGWFDLVSADLEGSGYAVGAADLCAAGLGAPHIRQRLWFVGVADRDDAGLERRGQPGRERAAECFVGSDGLVGRVADSINDGQRQHGDRLGGSAREGEGGSGQREWLRVDPANGGADGRMADADGRDARAEREQPGGQQRQQPQDGGVGRVADDSGLGRSGRQRLSAGREHGGADAGRKQGHDGPLGIGEVGNGPRRPGPVNGVWRDADWLYCRDGKWRPVEPGTFPLAHGIPGRVGLLRGYGNAIVPEAAQAFIEAYLDTETLDYRTETA